MIRLRRGPPITGKRTPAGTSWQSDKGTSTDDRGDWSRTLRASSRWVSIDGDASDVKAVIVGDPIHA